MAKSKTFSIHAESAILAHLAEAIVCYSKAAYPPGGSECGQVTSDALMTTAQSIRNAQMNGNVELRIRQRRLLISAVNWYCEEAPHISTEQRQILTQLLQKSA